MSLPRRIANLFSRSRIQTEIDAELRSHIEMRTADNIAAGMSPDEGRRDALLRFGNPTAVNECTTSADTTLTLASIASDICFAIRQLRKSPGFAWTSILTLALGIGTCTAIFSAIKPILIDPLPYSHARQLMMLREMGSDGGPRNVNFATFHGLTERTQSFSALAAIRAWQPAMTSTDRPGRLDGQRVTADYFRTLGIAPILGRDFTRADDRFRAQTTSSSATPSGIATSAPTPPSSATRSVSTTPSSPSSASCPPASKTCSPPTPSCGRRSSTTLPFPSTAASGATASA
jgi:macrolide transport system ATP-binding/permease protein